MMRKVVSLIGGLLLLAACSTAHPVLYPNAHLQSVGKDIAEQDIEACRELAKTAGAEEGSGKASRVATGTVVGGGVGAASGAVGGAISGAVGRGSPRRFLPPLRCRSPHDRPSHCPPPPQPFLLTPGKPQYPAPQYLSLQTANAHWDTELDAPSNRLRATVIPR